MDCTWITFGLMGGSKIKEFDINKFMKKRIHWIFSTLRNRSDDYKSNLIKEFSKDILPYFDSGRLKPIVDTVYNVENINEAHKKMEENKNIGKILIVWN